MGLQVFGLFPTQQVTPSISMCMQDPDKHLSNLGMGEAGTSLYVLGL